MNLPFITLKWILLVVIIQLWAIRSLPPALGPFDRSCEEALGSPQNQPFKEENVKKQNERLKKELMNSYSNYYLHIPKAGGFSALEYLKLDRLELSAIAGSGKVCNHFSHISGWKTWKTCWLHAAESTFSEEPARRFVVLRDPVRHVLSMWNYCTQSPKRKRKSKTMPASINVWLDEWERVKSLKIQCPQFAQGTGTERGCPSFRCYNPIDLQTKRTGMIGRNPMDLKGYYEVVGIVSELEKSTCLVSIAIHHKVPKRCICQKDALTENRTEQIRLDHGVISHGDDMAANITSGQLQIIENITKNDAALFKAAEEIFWRKVREVEKQYLITLC